MLENMRMNKQRVAIMSQTDETQIAHVKAKSCTPALSWKTERGMMPFLIVSATRAPTNTAPVVYDVIFCQGLLIRIPVS